MAAPIRNVKKVNKFQIAFIKVKNLKPTDKTIIVCKYTYGYPSNLTELKCN